jgi:hypothetical protein
MFAITSKVKIAAGIAAGALTLGAAGAYAANANNTITVTPTPITVGSGSHQLNLIGFNGTTSLTLPAGGFKNAGECVSFLAKNKNIALAPASTSGSVKLSKNYHGKLMSSANAWCKTQLTPAAKTADNADATDATDATDTNDVSASHGHGHAYGHTKHRTS